MTFDSSRILEEITRTSILLLLTEPFYSHFFSCLNKKIVAPDGDIQTLGVGLTDNSHTLYVNPFFWDTILLKSEHRYGVVKHEVLHIVFKHTLVANGLFDRFIMNIAMDLVVNQYIERSYLPDESLFLEDFPELQLEKDQTWHYYYHKIAELKNGLKGKFLDTRSAQTFLSINNTSHGLSRHEKWSEIYEQNSVSKTLTEAQIDNLVHISHQRTSQKSYGTLPAGIRLWIEQILFKPIPLVDWRRVVKLFSESSSKTKIKTTLKRPSKRYGTVPGIKVKKLRKMLVAIDTSGSTGKEELIDFFSEIYHIWRVGTEVEVVECDAKIQQKYKYRGQAPEFVMGRGGTDFNAPILYGNETFLPDGLIYFTDGFAPPPAIIPRFPILWVISKQGIDPQSPEFSLLPGRKAKLLS